MAAAAGFGFTIVMLHTISLCNVGTKFETKKKRTKKERKKETARVQIEK